MSAPPRALIHASCIAIGGRAVLIAGRSGTGKSDLAMRLIDRGAMLVSDDYTEVTVKAGAPTASAPDRIAGKIELRHVGILTLPFASDVAVALMIDLDGTPQRLPEPASRVVLGVRLPVIALSALEPSAPIKVEAALQMHGLPLCPL